MVSIRPATAGPKPFILPDDWGLPAMSTPDLETLMGRLKKAKPGLERQLQRDMKSLFAAKNEKDQARAEAAVTRGFNRISTINEAVRRIEAIIKARTFIMQAPPQPDPGANGRRRRGGKRARPRLAHRPRAHYPRQARSPAGRRGRF